MIFFFFDDVILDPNIYSGLRSHVVDLDDDSADPSIMRSDDSAYFQEPRNQFTFHGAVHSFAHTVNAHGPYVGYAAQMSDIGTQ